MNCEKCGGENTAVTVHSFGSTHDNPFAESWYECQKCGFTFPSVAMGWIVQGNKRCLFDDSAKSFCGKLIQYNPMKDGAYSIYIWFPDGSQQNTMHPDNCPDCVAAWIKQQEEECEDIGTFYDFLWELVESPKHCAKACEHFTREPCSKGKHASCDICLNSGGRNICLIRKSQSLITEMFSKETANSKKLTAKRDSGKLSFS